MSKALRRVYRKKYTKKRNPYKTYSDANWNWNDLFIKIDLLKRTMKTSWMYLSTMTWLYQIILC